MENIECGLSKNLNETVEVKDYYGYMGKESDIPGNHLGSGVFERDDGKFVHHNGNKGVSFKDKDAAYDFAEIRRNKFKKDLESAHNEMKANTKNMSDADLAITKNYTDHLNHFSRNGLGLNEHLHNNLPLDDKQKEFVKSFDSVLNNHSAPDDMVVYTGTNSNHANIIRGNGVVNHPGYLSTSLSHNSARSFANQKGGDIVKIHIPKGHPGLYVSHLSNYEGEREFVLPRNTKLKIHKDKEQVLLHDSGKYTVHHATIEN
jgi:hypothetical protein